MCQGTRGESRPPMYWMMCQTSVLAVEPFGCSLGLPGEHWFTQSPMDKNLCGSLIIQHIVGAKNLRLNSLKRVRKTALLHLYNSTQKMSHPTAQRAHWACFLTWGKVWTCEWVHSFPSWAGHCKWEPFLSPLTEYYWVLSAQLGVVEQLREQQPGPEREAVKGCRSS